MVSLLCSSAALMCLFGALLTGCADDEAEPLLTMELDCEAAIDLTDMPPDDYRTVLDAVALPGAGTPHEIGRTDESSGLGFAKAGLLVRAGVASTITVADTQHRVGWGTTETAQRIVIPPCTGATEWLVYAGGFHVPEPACMTLDVETENGSDEMRFPIDAPCP